MKQDKVIVNVILKGIRPLMLNPYSGDNKTILPPEEKFYKDEKGGLVMPSANIQSFLCAENTKSAVKMFNEPKIYKRVAQAVLSYVSLDQFEIPLTRKGKQLKFQGFGKGGITLHKAVARLKGGIPSPQQRPLIDTPWGLAFSLTIWPNNEVSERDIRLLFDRGGMAIGLGTYRGVYGKFVIEKWDV